MGRASQPRLRRAVGFAALFFGLFYLYVWLVINPRLLYESHPRFPVFFTGAAFLRATVTRYGGLVEYISGFLAQSYYFPWLGALVITLITGLACLALDMLVRAMGGSGARFGALALAAIVIVAHNHHLNQITILVGLLVALACAALYARVPLKRDLPRVALFLVLSLLLYFAAGGAYLLFAALAGIYELLTRQRRLAALVALLSMEAIPHVLGTYVLEVSLTDSFARLLPFHPDMSSMGREAIVGAYLLPPIIAAAVGTRQLIASHRKARRGDSAPVPPKTSERAGRRGLLRRLGDVRPHPAVGWLLCLALTAGAAFLTYDRQTMTRLRIDYYARYRMWEHVLRAAEGIQPDHYGPLVAQHVNEALYHTGRLPHEMFRYPQRPDELLFDMESSQSMAEKDRKRQAVNECYYRIGDLDLRLGLVNEAEREAHEALATHGEHGCVLYRLALINIAKKQPEAASVFLRALRRHLIYSREAGSLLRRIEADPSLSSAPGIEHLRSVMLSGDETAFDFSGESDYQALLATNRHNRMAFEYLMGFYLLTANLDRFVENLPRLRDLNYPGLPRHYQEAILVYEKATEQQADRCGYEISEDVLQEFAQFCTDLDVCGSVPVATQTLMPRYGNTYFYYYATGLCGSGDR